MKDRFDQTTRTIVVQSLVLSIINYCLKVWGMTTQQQIERIQKLENFAAKIAFGRARKYDHVTPILHELKWLNINCKVMYDIQYVSSHTRYVIIYFLIGYFCFQL